jgi:hypothetical protein
MNKPSKWSYSTWNRTKQIWWELITAATLLLEPTDVAMPDTPNLYAIKMSSGSEMTQKVASILSNCTPTAMNTSCDDVEKTIQDIKAWKWFLVVDKNLNPFTEMPNVLITEESHLLIPLLGKMHEQDVLRKLSLPKK